jgi:FtsP/CotA-like multicopper oxidase with cupredoxin domain
MNTLTKRALPSAIALAVLGATGVAKSAVFVQCPGDTNGNAQIDVGETLDPAHPNAVCKHLIAGDSFVTMSDGNPMYTFGFGEQTGTLPADVIADGILDAEWPGPIIVLDEGDEFFLSLTNVGTVIRPDLFDPHTVHFHGFPNAAAVFDGVPEVSISINHGATLTYYYNIVEPGTYMYHCHVEASEHMEMGMLANLYVRPAQNRAADGVVLGSHTHGNPDYAAAVAACTGVIDVPETPVDEHAACVRNKDNPLDGDTYVYNDGDGTTRYDVEVPLQVGGFDSNFHDASLFVQPLPFATLKTTYPMINGRGYPDTIGLPELPAPVDNLQPVAGHPAGKVTGNPGEVLNNGTATQTMNSVIQAAPGQKLLLRLSNLSVDRFYTLTAQGLTMRVVGTGARQMRGVTDKNLYRDVASVNIGGGESHDVIIDTAGVAPGTYFLYATELHQLSNLTQFDGGLMTEIVIAAAP